MLDFFFLSSAQVFGIEKLDIFKKNAELILSPTTDFSILLGGYSSVIKKTFYIENENYFIGDWWTNSYESEYSMITVSEYGNIFHDVASTRCTGARPVINYSKIKGFVQSSKVRSDGILEVEFGEYPQFVVENGFLEDELEEKYNAGLLKLTGKTYTTDSVDYDEDMQKFQEKKYSEYEYNGNKYIRFQVGYNGNEMELSDNCMYYDKDVCWIKVEPIKWLIDKEKDIALSKNILFAGVQYCYDERNVTDFKNTDIKWYLDTYFSKDIVPSNSILKDEFMDSKASIKYNPYNFDFSKVSEEEIIKGAVESNIAVFLHGKSSEGKSARVKQIDPDCEIIYLRNATPDSLNGKSVFNSQTNEMIDIPPTWYKKLVEKCEREPNKIHIVFFDEITNALPSIQGMAFNIVLDGEVNGKWKLPENARIVAAGNDLEDSKAAQEMAEPLFNRFAHVYINTTVDDWLKWASTPSEEYERLDYKQEELPRKIHPSIYAYIAYKSYSKQDVLRTPYTGLKPNADPRKWEMSSKVLYKTRKPEMLRALIGEDLTRDFAIFCSKQVITVEDVINNNYNESTLEMDVSEKFNTAVGLSSVDEEHIEIVRKFVKKLGPEICATFETLWAHGIEERLEKIQEIKLSERTK